MRRQMMVAGLLLIQVANAHAQDGAPVVLAEVEPAVVTVGEPVSLRVSVFAPTWFPQPPVFPSFELPNTLTVRPPNSGGPTSRRVGRETWSGVQRRYDIYPLTEGEFQLSGRSVRLVYADPESRAPISVDVAVPGASFSGRVPPGAEGLDPFIAGSALDLRQEVEADTSTLAAGDALVLRYRARLEGMPSMFLPPLFPGVELPGLSVYRDEPELSDEDGIAERLETVTLVFQGGGEFTLPARELEWWHRSGQRVETARIPPLTLRIAGVPLASDPIADTSRVAWWWLLAGGATVLLGGAVARRPVQQWLAARQAARDHFRRSEAYAFTLLRKRIGSGDPHLVYRALLDWLGRLDTDLTLDELSRLANDEALTRDLDALRTSLYGKGRVRSVSGSFEQLLCQVRGELLKQQQRERFGALPLLNP